MNPRVALIINGLCALVLGWLYGGDAADALRAQSAEVSAYLEPPNLVFALGALLAQHFILRGRQHGAPFGIGMGYSKAFPRQCCTADKAKVHGGGA